MCAVGIMIPQALWVIDFVAGVFGFQVTGMTTYMFNSNNSLFLHKPVPVRRTGCLFMLVYLVWTIGYDRRGLPALDRPRLGLAAGVFLPDAAAGAPTRA